MILIILTRRDISEERYRLKKKYIALMRIIETCRIWVIKMITVERKIIKEVKIVII